MAAAGATSVLSIAREGDTWLHVAVGEQILSTHALPTTDSYSFTAYGNDAIAYEWLGDLPFGLAGRLGGLRGLMALLMGLSAAWMVLLYGYARQRSGNPKAAFVACLLLLPLAAPFFTLRPQLIGYMFLLVTMILLDRFRQGRLRKLWALPALFVVWVNVHPTFVFGLLVLAFSWAGGLIGFRRGTLEGIPWRPEQRRHMLLVALLCVLALTVTPYGTRVAASPMDILSHSPLGVANIGEYQPLGAFPALLKWFLALLLGFLLAQAAFRPTFTLEEIGLLLLSVYAACVHARMLFFFVVVFAPRLARLLGRWVPGYQPAKDRPALNAALILLGIIGLPRFFPTKAEVDKDVSAVFPKQAVEYLRQHLVRGPMFNQYGWGGYLIWTMGPKLKVFIDGRSQLYEVVGVYGDYLRIEAVAPDTPLLLRKYGIEACLIDRKTGLATFLAALPGWHRVYQDALSVLFEKKQEAGRSTAR